MPAPNEQTILYHGEHLTLAQRGHWEFATRNTNRPAVGIVAITDSGDVVLVEQYRPPVERNIVELPAGLSGDISGAEDEALLEAAQRELLEETGYTATKWVELGNGYSSPGLTDETIVLFLATGLKKSGLGGGDESESIQVHEIAMSDVTHWLAENGHAADLKMLAGLHLAQQQMSTLDGR